jgi:hypothetical protein
MRELHRDTTLEDMKTLQTTLNQFFDGVRGDDWSRKTGSRDQDWTLLETLAHLTSVMSAFNDAIEAGMRGQAIRVGTVQKREDLRQWNTETIADLSSTHTPTELIAQMNDRLGQAATYAAILTPQQAAHEVLFPIYNRPAPLWNFVEWQLSHAGAVHGAQMTRALDQAPLWERFGGPMRQRQLDRFLRHFSWAYWQSHAPDLTATIHMQVAEDFGGDWALVAAPDGGAMIPGVPDSPDFVLWFANPDTLFSVFTMNLSFVEAMKRGVFRVDHGEARRALTLITLFAPSPPKRHL